MANLRTRLGRFVDGNPDRRVCDVTPKELRSYVERPGNTNRSSNNSLRALKNFFRWCQRRDYMVDNPTEKLETYQEEPAEPEIFTLEQTRALMSANTTFLPAGKIIPRGKNRHPQARPDRVGFLIPHLAIGIFAEIRPVELHRLTWEDIDLAEKWIQRGQQGIHNARAAIRGRHRQPSRLAAPDEGEDFSDIPEELAPSFR